MSSHNKIPPAPPASQSNKGPGDTHQPNQDTSVKKGAPDNLKQQARQGNINQNTHHQGYQQDR